MFDILFCAITNQVAPGCVNARSVLNIAETILQIIAETSIGIFAITETWHDRTGCVELKRITLHAYKYIDVAPLNRLQACEQSMAMRNHGGIAVVYRCGIELKHRPLKTSTTTFGHLSCTATSSGNRFLLPVVYRSGSQSVTTIFSDEIMSVFEELVLFKSPLLSCVAISICIWMMFLMTMQLVSVSY
jgi:hypothetical protein